jgi:tRNA threonylcarbamoyladenosine biosynthesis protein TsaB
MKALLALDTAGPVLSAALAGEGRRWYRETDAGISHSELLLPLAEGLFKDAALGPEDLEAVACMRGPGSFTGLRVGFSAAKGMALALGIPLIACPTLDCMAYPWSLWPGLTLPLLDARGGCFFAALYAGGRRITEEMDAEPRAIVRRIRSLPPGGAAGEVLVTGPGAPLFLSRLGEGEDLARMRQDPLCRRGRAWELAAVAKQRLIVNNGEDDALSAPEYIRENGAAMSS